ncbi:MAG: HAD hydrolase family protein, partial [Liquorilactobacillus hordei]
KNGSELAKKHADYITDTNDSDGLAKALQKSILNKIK